MLTPLKPNEDENNPQSKSASNNTSNYWNLPNKLSTLRIAVTPLVILLLISPGKVLSAVAALLFLIVALTDWLDGYLARKMDAVTDMGKFLDPLADKLLIITTLVMLIPLERVPAWMVAFIIAREIAVTGLRTMAVSSGVVISASILGKAKTVMQIVAVVPLLVHYTYFSINFQSLGTIFLWAAFILTMYSGFDYFYKFLVNSSKK
jgi:CDP-diacylglycerol--glycerol-3-phosphate 3-phosphatidyltransferase